MRITVAAIGRLKAGPERDLFERFLKRAEAAGRRLGLSFQLREFAESRAANPDTRKEQEAGILRSALAEGAALVILDEKGKAIDSPGFAASLATWRDNGRSDVSFVIGGPDGLSADLMARADLRLAFGAMTWPHQLVRVMLAEQLYRAVTILSGHPYHRE